jgi:uncharacterized membrane protein
MLILLLGTILFLGVHSVSIVAPGWRGARAAAFGENAWKGLYSVVALAGFALIVWGYGLARPGAAVLYEPPAWLAHLAALLMLPAMIALAAYLLPAGRLKPALKHPMLAAVKIWALAHLLANGDAASVFLFGAVLAWAVADRISLKRRNARVVRPGPVLWDIAAVVLGAVLYLLFAWRLHVLLFGVTPFG